MTDARSAIEPPPVAPAMPSALPRLSGGRLRAAFRIVAITLWSAGLTLAWALGTFALLPLPRSRVHWRHRIVRRWARGVARLAGVRITVTGKPPQAPFFLVSNHLSYLDIIVLYTCVDGVFIAKQQMRHWPLLGPLANLFATIWVNREVRRDAVRVLDRIDEAIAKGDGVILFAEGTTSSGAELLPMRPALFDWAAREQYPVHTACLTYQTPPDAPPAYLTVCWWGEMPFAPHVLNLSRLRRVEAMVEFGATTISAPSRGELAERVQSAIAGRFFPVHHLPTG